MSNTKKVVAVVLARGGSKGIPRKNIKDFCGKPLIAWTIIPCVKTSEISEVYISSDSDEILDIAAEYGAKKIKRPDELANDTATSEAAMKHALQVIGPESVDIAFMLEPTAPLRKPDDFSRAIQQFRRERWDSAISGAILEDFLIWEQLPDGSYKSFNFDYLNRGRRQDRKPQYVENGSIYYFKPEILLKGGNRLGGKIGIFLQDFWQSFELDKPEDWDFVSALFKHYLAKDYLK